MAYFYLFRRSALIVLLEEYVAAQALRALLVLTRPESS